MSHSSEYLVLTAIGADRTGIVSELIKLASQCGCNIIDSRMAIFGREFTLIMLLEGSPKAINTLEVKFPQMAHKLELITMMKRTSGYVDKELTQHFEVTYAGIEQPGILKAVTAFFAARNIDISSLKSQIDQATHQVSAHILIALSAQNDVAQLEHDFLELCQQLDIQGCIKPTASNLL
jgi:glycine cleavage system transcriptional repressor